MGGNVASCQMGIGFGIGNISTMATLPVGGGVIVFWRRENFCFAPLRTAVEFDMIQGE